LLQERFISFEESIESSFTMGELIVSFKNNTKLLSQIDKDWINISKGEFFLPAILVFKKWNVAQDVQIMFDEEYSESNIVSAPIISTQPKVTVMDKLLYKPLRGDKMIINGINFEVQSYLPDGTGIATLTLQNSKTN
jgi:hypothetical protein